MASDPAAPPMSSAPATAPILDDRVRLRLGRQLQALYEPVLDETLDPRLADLLSQLEQARRAEPSP